MLTGYVVDMVVGEIRSVVHFEELLLSQYEGAITAGYGGHTLKMMNKRPWELKMALKVSAHLERPKR